MRDNEHKSIFELLRARHEPPAWAFLDEVRNGTGLAEDADAIAAGARAAVDTFGPACGPIEDDV